MNHRLQALAIAAAASLLAGGCPSDPKPAWSVALDGDDLDRVVLSAWGTSAEDVYVVGGGLGNGLGALALHYDGAQWTEIQTAADETFWWVWGPAPGTTYFVGEEGAILRLVGTTAERLATPTDQTLYGAWGSGANDIWAVGGDATANPPTAVVLHYDGLAWTERTLPFTPGGALFKVWGSSADDVWACGQSGAMLHFDGSEWSEVDSGVSASLFTVYGDRSDNVWAVGGPSATVAHYDGSAWSEVDTGLPASVLNGVAIGPEGEVVVVGMNGVKFRFADGVWTDETLDPPFIDLHAAWIGPQGDTYAVGGNFFAPGSPGSVRIGVVAYHGTEPPPSSL